MRIKGITENNLKDLIYAWADSKCLEPCTAPVEGHDGWLWAILPHRIKSIPSNHGEGTVNLCSWWIAIYHDGECLAKIVDPYDYLEAAPRVLAAAEAVSLRSDSARLRGLPSGLERQPAQPDTRPDTTIIPRQTEP